MTRYQESENGLKGCKIRALNLCEGPVSQSIEFERKVAAIFRALGGTVEHDTELAGNQIDVLVTESTPSGVSVRTAVECKAFAKQVGLGTTNFYSQLSQLLKQRGLIDKFALVAQSGFTKNSRKAAREHGLELMEYADLEAKVIGREESIREEEIRVESEQSKAGRDGSRKKRVFVVMPFSREFEDVFFLGIQDVGQRLGLVVERADLIQHADEIMDVITQRIKRADTVVGDITTGNANVHYEIGLAHANSVPTILIMRSGGQVPFDLRAFNVLIYENVTRLREDLARRLEVMLKLRGGVEEDE